MTLSLHIPAQHPYLAITSEEIAKAKERMAHFAWARDAMQSLRAEADAIIASPPPALPPVGDSAHYRIADNIRTAGLVSAFTGERRYAEWARDRLLAYADLYPGLPQVNHRGKLFPQESLQEAMWAVKIAEAYDLVADSGVFTDEQKRHVENDLLRASTACFKIDDFQNDPRIRDLHYRCYNFQAWHLAAVGLAGLAIRDSALADYAVNSPYGFKHLVAHDIRDDGIFWERSVGYHQFVVQALLPLAEAMGHCGVDLYHLTVPNLHDHNEGVHYVTETSTQPKSFRLMFEAPFYLLFPDLSFPALGDSDTGPRHADWRDLVAYQRYHAPELAWLLERDAPLANERTHGRVGFLHYYRYQYRYDDVRLNGQPVKWERTDPTFKLEGDSIEVADQDVSQQDRYLISDTDVGDFTLEFTLTRQKDAGQEDRAWLIFHVDARDPENRIMFGLPSLAPEIGRPYRFRLEVAGKQARLFRDGAQVASTPEIASSRWDWHWLIYDAPQLEADHTPVRGSDFWHDGSFANTGEFRNGCSLFPSTGLAVLRQQAGDFTTHPDSTAVALTYGPYGGGHNHPDKLSIVLYADGRQWIPHFGSMPYETHWKSEWTAQTISHNTLVAGGISQRPTGERNVMWPSDSADERVVGKLERFDPGKKFVSASCDSAYAGLTLQRTVQLSGNCVVDRFDVHPSEGSAASPRQLDYVLHVDGALADSSAPLAPAEGALGSHCGYQYVIQQKQASITGVTALTFQAGKKRLRIWIVPADGQPLQLIVADGLTNTPGTTMPMLLLRQTGTAARFLTVLEPVDTQDPIRSVRLDGSRLTLDRAAHPAAVPMPRSP